MADVSQQGVPPALQDLLVRTLFSALLGLILQQFLLAFLRRTLLRQLAGDRPGS